MTRRLLLLSALGALVLTACVPAATKAPARKARKARQPAAMACVRTTPSSAAAYQGAFDTLRRTYTEWATADGSVPVGLPDGRTLWLYGDTFVGKVTNSGVLKPPQALIANSAVLQSGGCFTPLMGGGPGARGPWIASPAPGEAFWPASAVVDPAGRLQVFLMHVRYSPFTVFGFDVATFTLPSLSLRSITPLPFTSAERPYGTTAFSDGAFAYLYSSHDQEQRLARVRLDGVTRPSSYEFWTGSAWSPDAGSAAALSFVDVPTPVVGIPLVAPIGGLSVTRRGNGFLGTTKLVNQFSDDVSLFGAPAPEGPWTYLGRAATTPGGVFTYGAQTALTLQGMPSIPALIFSTNVPGTPSTILQYGPRFVAPANVPASINVTAATVPTTATTSAPSTSAPSTTVPTTSPPTSAPPTTNAPTTTAPTTTSSSTTSPTAPG